MCPLLKTTHSYEATVYGFCNRCVVNYKRYSFVELLLRKPRLYHSCKAEEEEEKEE
jgi:hypothetical protein